jgi:hypothetical protein
LENDHSYTSNFSLFSILLYILKRGERAFRLRALHLLLLFEVFVEKREGLNK